MLPLRGSSNPSNRPAASRTSRRRRPVTMSSRGVDHHLRQTSSRTGDCGVVGRQRCHDRTEVGADVGDRAHDMAPGCPRPQLVAGVEDRGRARSRRQCRGAPRGRSQRLDLVVARAQAGTLQEGERHEREAGLRHVDPDHATSDVRDVRHRGREAQRQAEAPIDSGEDRPPAGCARVGSRSGTDRRERCPGLSSPRRNHRLPASGTAPARRARGSR